MKWLIFTGACVIALISLGILAVDERDVVWEGRKSLCPYCRAEVAFYAVACNACERTLDWETRKEPCRWCLEDDDVRILKDGIDALQLEEDEALPASVAEFTKSYLFAIEAGACTYCGGLGQVLEAGAEVVCPVCRGDQQCVACEGSRTVVVGDKQAHQRWLERRRLWEQAVRREHLTRLPLRREQLVDDDVAALRGYAEAEGVEDVQGKKLLERARGKIVRAFKAIQDAVKARAAARPEPAADGS